METGPKLSRSGMNRVGLDKGLAVDVDLLVPNLDRVSGQADHPLDKVFVFILGKHENDNVPALWAGNGDKNDIKIGDMHPIDKLVDQDVIADLKRGDHRPGRNFKCLHDEGPYHQGQENRNDKGFPILPKGRFLFHVFGRS